MPRGRKRQANGILPDTRPTPSPDATPGTVAFTPIDRGALWGRLRLNSSQVAELSGATLRQVIHWTDQGYLPHVPGEARIFSGAGLDTALLMVHARESGLSAKRAAELARQYLAAEFRGAPRPTPPGPSTLGAGLRVIEGAARELREQVAPDIDEADAAG